MARKKKNISEMENNKAKSSKKLESSNGIACDTDKKICPKKPIIVIAKTENQKKLLQSIKENTVTIVSGPPGTGKAQRISADIYTPNGVKAIGELKVGDEICTPDGAVAKVASLHPQGKKDVYRINFADGDFVECCEDHLWKVRDKYHSNKNKFDTDERIVDTKFLIEKLNNKSNYSKNRFKIDTPECCYFEHRSVKIDPYLMGCLLGDGSLIHNLGIRNIDSQILDVVEDKILKYGCHFNSFDGRCFYSVSSLEEGGENKILSLLKDYSLWGIKSEDKFIPYDYKINDRDVRLSILQGLMDTDGMVDKKYGLPSFSSSSKRLAEDVKFLIESLGGICVIREKLPFYYDFKGRKIQGKINYVCHIRYNEAKNLFNLDRKKEIVKNREKYLTKRVIRSIEKVGEDECICIYVDSDDHMYLTNNFVPTHNTLISVTSGLREFVMGRCDKMIFTRPCVEANGENLGFLPGDLNEKISPYMLPIMDFLSDYLQPAKIDSLIKEGAFLTLPLAFQRGMAQPVDAEILTLKGYRKMGDIQKGDYVVGGDGCPVLVEEVFDKGEKDIYRVYFSDNTFTECCLDHLWATKTLDDKKHGRSYTVKSTRDIINTLKVSSGQNNHEIPIVSSPVLFSESEVPIDPYLLGILLGDGSLHKISSIKVTTKDLEILNNIASVLPENMIIKYVSQYDYRLIYKKGNGIGNPLKREIKNMGLLGSMSHNKFIPDEYKFNSADIRLEILRGLMDADGSIYLNKNNDNRIEFSTNSERLCDDVMFIVQSLGGICYKRVKKNKLNEKIIISNKEVQQDYNNYVLDISLFDYNLFKLSRKAEMFTSNNPRRRPERIITEIKKIGKKQCKCIRVANEDGLYLTNDCIVTHNTFRNSFVILDEAQNTIPGQIRMFLTRLGENCKVVITGDPFQTDIKQKNGLVDAIERLEGVNGLGIVSLDKNDIVRHPIVEEIENRYYDMDKK